MSAFLGPIHVRMYDRILYQDEISLALLTLAKEKGWADGLQEMVETKAPAASKEPLEAIIDQSNIHGWLSGAVMGSERRFALIVSSMLAEHPERLGELQAAMKDLGKQYESKLGQNAEQAHQKIHDVLLDGMPCDFPFQVTESGENQVVWQVTSCPHTLYWKEAGNDVETYYLLRDAWVEGALGDSGFVHTRTNDQHTLRKER